MFQYEDTAIFNSEFNIPKPDESVSGSYTIGSAIGVPDNFESNKVIYCKVNINASINGADFPLIKAESISRFAVINDDSPESIIRDKADKECSPVAIKKTMEKLSDATKVLCGKRIDLPNIEI